MYISSASGNDSWSCDWSNPCETIGRAVSLASDGDSIYLDGTDTDKRRYTCQSGVSEHPGIYINKSLSLIGYGRPMPQIRCLEGTGFDFNGSDCAEQMNVTLSGLFVNESFLSFQDCSAKIDGCKFEGSKHGVEFVKSSKMSWDIQISNSTFSKGRQCISIALNGTNNTTQSTQVLFTLTNSTFEGNVLSDNGTCISFIKSSNTKDSVSCDITLENVRFSRNWFTSNGLFILKMDGGNQKIHLLNVTFHGNSPLPRRDVLSTIDGDSEFVVNSKSSVLIFINSSNFTSQTARAFNVSASNVSFQVTNSSFWGHRVKGNGGVISLRGTDLHKLIVFGSSFVNTTAAQGGVINIECTRVYNVSFQDSNFTGNKATNGEGGAVYIYSPGWVWNNAEYSTKDRSKSRKSIDLDLLRISINKCHFNNAYSALEGGAVCIYVVKASVQLRHSSFTNCTAIDEHGRGGGGGAGVFIYSGLPSLELESNYELFLNVESSFFMECTSDAPFVFGGALAAFYKTQVELSINNSFFISNYGGALLIDDHGKKWTQKSNVTIENSLFLNNIGNVSQNAVGAVVILVYNHSIVILKNVTMESNGLVGSGGAATFGSNFTLKIYLCRFLQNVAHEFGGAIYTFDLNLLLVQDSLFDGNFVPLDLKQPQKVGGALCVSQRAPISFSTVILIFNTTFSNCSSGNSGGALYLSHIGNLHLELKDSLFIDNTVFTEFGGAIFLSLSPDTLKNPGCIQKDTISQINSAEDFPSWDYKSHLAFESTTFERNAAVSGGALHLNNGKAIFYNCSFIDNFSTTQQGHIYTVPGSASLVILDSVFRQTVKERLLPQVNYSQASFIHAESSGALKLYNTTLDATPYGGNSPLMQVRNGRLIDLGNNNMTAFNCPVGSQMEIFNFTTQVTTYVNNVPCRFKLLTLEFRCSACAGNSYSLQRGRALGSQLVPGFQCLVCPFGANCSQNIIAQPNFWGFKEKVTPALTFTLCPLGYCRPPMETDFPEYNGCQGNRSGELCGKCIETYTETLYSTNCRPSRKCKDNWFWPVILVYVSLMAFYFTFKPPVVYWIERQILWFKEREPANLAENNFDRGYLKILFYFYQAANLLLISDSAQHVLQTKFIEPLIGLFNFQPKFSSTGFICPLPGLTAVTKQLFSASHVFATLFMIGAYYIFSWGVHKFRGQVTPLAGPYIGGVLQTVLLGYTTLASVSLNLLRCVSIGSQQRLFYDGNQKCFQWWRNPLIVFIVTSFVPFVFVLLWGSLKLYNRTVSVGSFLLACFFPLPSLLYWSYVYLFCGARNAATVADTRSSQMSRISVEKVLYDSFKRPENGRSLSLSWESVMIGRRLILVVLRTFISDPMTRLLLMSLFCVFFLLHHALSQPFRDRIANIAETVSLMSLVVLALVNVFFASFFSLAVPLNDHFSSWSRACQVVEIILLVAVPSVFGLLVVAAVLSQLCRLTVMVCRRLYYLCRVCFSWCR